MAELADHPPVVAGPGKHPSAADLAVEMRAMVTPVIGYLELMSDDASAVPADRRLRWIATIERRLEGIEALNEQIASACAALRESLSDPGAPGSVSPREAATRRAPEAPAG